VEHPDRLLWALEKAAFLAINGNPGPVYIEIPENLTEVPAVAAGAFVVPTVLRNMPLTNELETALSVLTTAQRPLFLIGGGAKNSSSNGIFMRLAEYVGAAVFTTASGRGVVDEGHPLFCGLAGLYTAKPMREMWQEADLIVVFGSRMEETATMLMDTAANARKVIQIDVDMDNFSHRHTALKLWGDCAATAKYWADHVNGREVKATHWTGYIGELKQVIFRQKKELLDKLALSPQVHVAEILAGIEEVIPADSAIVQENGLLDMWSYFYPYFTFKSGQVSIVPSEQTTLGFGAAAAVGVKLANPDSMVIAFVGDGAFNMFRPDLFTTADNNIPVTYIVLNNHSFGWLEYQLRCQDLTHSPFRFKGDTQVTHPSIVTMEIKTKDQLNSVLAKARQHNLEGKTVVMDVAIRDIDVAPGVKDFYGEFKD
jgi:acetolactate synthase-1/2/3 large subunit